MLVGCRLTCFFLVCACYDLRDAPQPVRRYDQLEQEGLEDDEDLVEQVR
jgi:hypothetical protein